MVFAVKQVKIVSLRRRHAAQGLTWNVLVGLSRVFFINDKNLLIVRHRSYGIAILLALDNHVGDNFIVNQWTHAIVNQNDVIFSRFAF